MDSNPLAANKPDSIPAGKHWLFQLIPPLFMLAPLFLVDSGTSLVFIAGFLLLPVLVSLISLVVKLIFFRRKKYFLPRPLLTIALFALVLTIADWTYHRAREQVIEDARIIHLRCNEESVCPQNPAGWTVRDLTISRRDLGIWLKYSATYRYQPQSFVMRVYRGPDLGDTVSGGVNRPFEVKPYRENQDSAQ